jgi:hypothetical protein
MNWEAISAIAELFGAVGVIITVIYLAIQIRQNTSSVQAATEQTLMSQEIEVFALTAAHAEVYQRGLIDLASLSKAERVVFDHVMYAQMSQFYSGWVQYKGKFIEGSVWKAYENSAMLTMSDSGFRQAWEEVSQIYPEDFQDVVAEIVDRLESD